MTSPFAATLERARQDYLDRNTESHRHHRLASEVMPGGNTRTVLHYPPFPVTLIAGEGSHLTDADGRVYLDFLGDYTAGLLGHSDHRALDAVMAALRTNMSVGGHHPAEEQLARLICERFRIDRVRFTNSGTEANLMAITAARLVTGKPKILVMEHGYHGGVLYYGLEPAPWSAPYPTVMVAFNDLPAVVAAIEQHADELAAVIVEPMMGGAGCIPAAPGFLRGVVDAAHANGVLSIFDEVMTSRHGAHGFSALHDAEPDMKTFGKYIGAGFSFGAFGGRAEVMRRFDPNSPDCISHAGTFNNNIASLSAGVKVLSELYTSDIAIAHTARGEEFRAQVAAVLAHHPVPLVVSGYGTMMTIIARAELPTNGVDGADRDAALQELVYLGLLRRGFYTAPRGMVNLSLPLTDDDLAAFLDALDDVCAELAG
jgi:glutamate-1-semialdehyde 2,1-aminomutase